MRDAGLVSTGDSICEWTDAAVRFTLRVSPELMPRLGIESWAAYRQVPRRGLEIGGILLGRTEIAAEQVNLWITGFRTVDSEHRWGPSYVLSDGDFDRLREDVQECGQEAVGLFRSHTRSPELTLDARDTDLLTQCFGAAPALFLLLGPLPQKASVFTNLHGEPKCVFERPLMSSLSAILTLKQNHPKAQADLHGGTEPQIAAGVPENAPEANLPAPHPVIAMPLCDPPAEPQPIEPRALKPAPAKSGWMAKAAMGLLASAVIADGVSHTRLRPAGEPPFVLLTVRPAGSSLLVTWDPAAPALRAPGHAVLQVDDGDRASERDLTAEELKSGSVSYRAQSGNVTFRLEVYPAEPKTVGIIQFQNAPTSESGTTAGSVKIVQPAPQAMPRGTEPNADTGPQRRPNLRGISVEPLSKAARNRLHLADRSSGVVVTHVRPGSGAYQAVLQEGDVIQEVDRQPVGGVAEFEQAMQNAARRAVLLSVSRNGAVAYHAVP